MDNTRKVGGYIRVIGEGSWASVVSSQMNSIEGFAKEKGLDINDYYIDAVDGGISLDERKGYSKLNSDILGGKINTILTTSLDTITDDRRELAGLMHSFAEKGVEIYLTTTGEHINPSGPLTREQRLLAEAMRDMEDAKAAKVKENRDM